MSITLGKSSDQRHPEIPVAIDDIKTDPAFPMARVEYLTVELDDLDSGWLLLLPNRRVPLLLYGLSGIIVQPSETQREFTSADDFDQLFNDIENQTQLLIESSDVWIPSDLIAAARKDATSGDVFRVRFDLFTVCFQFRQQRLDQPEFLSLAGRLSGAIRYSPDETGAYELWHERQVQAAVQNYAIQRASNENLAWMDSQGNIQPG